MFEQYTIEELEKKIALLEEEKANTDPDESKWSQLWPEIKDMQDEIKCRKTAERYKDLDDEALNKLYEERGELLYNLTHSGWKRAYVPRNLYTQIDRLSMERFRRFRKSQGFTELPIHHVLTDNEKKFKEEMSGFLDISVELEIKVEKERESSSPDEEKIKRWEKEIEETDQILIAIGKKYGIE
jgi:hypothetical protein